MAAEHTSAILDVTARSLKRGQLVGMPGRCQERRCQAYEKSHREKPSRSGEKRAARITAARTFRIFSYRPRLFTRLRYTHGVHIDTRETETERENTSVADYPRVAAEDRVNGVKRARFLIVADLPLGFPHDASIFRTLSLLFGLYCYLHAASVSY